jgi:HTH-type transcriptional regulator / antitoxin HigA
VRNIGRDQTVGPYDPSGIPKLANEIVHGIHDPTELAEIPGILRARGIAVVNLLPLRSSKLDGAVIMLESGKPIIGLSTRGDRMDGYVFTLLHELAHLHFRHLVADDVHIDDDLDASSDQIGTEAAANQQAAAWILPDSAELPSGRPTMSSVLAVAMRYRVHPCLVVGRIQRDRRDWGLLRNSIPRVRPFLSVDS